jgi:hypothetical protein
MVKASTLYLYSRVAKMYKEKLASLAQKAHKQYGTQVLPCKLSLNLD